MPAGVQLRTLLVDLRAEVGHSTQVAQGANFREHLIRLLQRTQRTLWMEHDWPNLAYDDFVTVSVGNRFYQYPTDMTFEQVNKIYCHYASEYTPLLYGIRPEDYATYNPDTTTGWPLQRWRHRPDKGQFEVWPTPNQTGSLLFRAQMQLAPLVDDDDVCTLDGDLIVLYAASEVLARQRADDAPVKLSKANQLRNRLLAQMGSDKIAPFVLGGGGEGHEGSRPGIDYIPMGR